MYQSKLSLLETEAAIKIIKDRFETLFGERLKLRRVSSPLVVEKDSGLNDYLSGSEPPVGFIFEQTKLEIVQSLAKWKRLALKRYDFKYDFGLYTDMNAIRPNEILSPIHSLYVDQWDWEKIIIKKERTISYLKKTVNMIFEVLKSVEVEINHAYPNLNNKLPDKVFYIDSEALLQMYPLLSSKEREYEITKSKKAVFIMSIGGVLSHGKPHDGRSPDYDDWALNGDLLVYHAPLDIALELSSMGIRVDSESLYNQLVKKEALDRLSYPYHQMIMAGELPLTIGGGIGQSRLCLFYLEKMHIGEVQASYWPSDVVSACLKDNIKLL
ncbi:MAG TPA: aspartate--ammonia ligase [Acholeplasma sp.]|nr:aspartate--ammonia ligase [Acholeplasma sp.]